MDFVPFESGPIAPTAPLKTSIPAKTGSAAPSTNIFRKYWWAWVLGACVLIGVTVGVVVATLPKSKKGVTRITLDRTSYKEGDTVKASFSTDKSWEEHKIRWEFSADNRATWNLIDEEKINSGVNFITFVPKVSSSSSQCYVHVIDDLDSKREIESEVFSIQLDLGLTADTLGSKPNEKVDPGTSLKVTLAWTNPWLDGATWQYRTKVDSGDWGTWITVTLTTKSFTFTTPASGEEFQYQVKATNGSNTETITSEWILSGDLTFTVVTLDSNNKPCQRFNVGGTLVIDIDTGQRTFPTHASFALTYQIGGAGPIAPIASTTTDKYSWVVPASVDNKSLTISATYVGQTVAASPVIISATPGLSNISFDALPDPPTVTPGSTVSVDVSASGASYDFSKLQFWYQSDTVKTPTQISATKDDTNSGVSQQRFRIVTPSTTNTNFKVGTGISTPAIWTTAIDVKTADSMVLLSVQVNPSPSSLTQFTVVVTFKGPWQPSVISATETVTSTTIAGSSFVDGPIPQTTKQFTYSDAGPPTVSRSMVVTQTGTNAKVITVPFQVNASGVFRKLEITTPSKNVSQNDTLTLKGTMISTNAFSDWINLFGGDNIRSSLGSFSIKSAYNVAAGTAINEILFTVRIKDLIAIKNSSLPIQNLSFSVPTSPTDNTPISSSTVTVTLGYSIDKDKVARIIDPNLNRYVARSTGVVTEINVSFASFSIENYAFHNFSAKVDTVKPIANVIAQVNDSSIKFLFYIVSNEYSVTASKSGIPIDVSCVDVNNQAYIFSTVISINPVDPNQKADLQYLYAVTLGQDIDPKYKEIYQVQGVNVLRFKQWTTHVCPFGTNANPNKDIKAQVFFSYTWDPSKFDGKHIMIANPFESGTVPANVNYFFTKQLSFTQLSEWKASNFSTGHVRILGIKDGSPDEQYIGTYQQINFATDGNNIPYYTGKNYVDKLPVIPFVLRDYEYNEGSGGNDLMIIHDKADNVARKYFCGDSGAGYTYSAIINIISTLPSSQKLPFDPRTIWFTSDDADLQSKIKLDI